MIEYTLVKSFLEIAFVGVNISCLRCIFIFLFCEIFINVLVFIVFLCTGLGNEAIEEG